MNSKERFQKEKFIQFKKQDRSSKGDIDKIILRLIEKINSKNDYYTTSSCSGRIVLIKGKEKKQEGLFIYRTHERISLKELKTELQKAIKKYHGLIYFKMESCIMHVACSSLQKAQEIINKAKLAGWKKSGVVSLESKKNRVMCELKSTENIEMPIAYKGRILVSHEFLRVLVKEANKKLVRTRVKIRKFYKLL